MSEDLEEIRKRKARELMIALDGKSEKDHEADIKELEDILPWAFRVTERQGEVFAEVLHHPQLRQSAEDPNVVAVCADPEWADMVTEMLNRAFLWQQSGLGGGEEE